MPYRVMVGDVAIECDSMEEALSLARHAGGDSLPPARVNGGAAADRGAVSEGSRWTEKRVGDFLKLVEGNQRKLINILMEHSEGRTDKLLCQALGLADGRQLGGVFTGLWKNAKKVGADPNDFYSKKRVIIGGQKAFEYFLSDSFRRIASKVLGK